MHEDLGHLPAAQTGIPKLRSISVACAAAIYRTALTTVTCWPKWISQLEICAKQFLPPTQLVKRNPTPSHWDSDPLALNLKHAYNGFSNDPQWAEGGAILSTKLLELNNNRPVLPGCEFLIRKKGIQKLAYSTLLASQFNLDFMSHLEERIQSMLAHGMTTQVDLEQGDDNSGYLDQNSINL